MPSWQGKACVENHYLALPFPVVSPLRRPRGPRGKARRSDDPIVEGGNLAALNTLLRAGHGMALLPRMPASAHDIRGAP